jgi:transcription antitermination factor NusG
MSTKELKLNDTKNVNWYVLFVVQGKDFAIKNSLEPFVKNGKIEEVLLPTVKQISEIRRKKIVRNVPVYSSYLFIKAYLLEELQSYILNEINFVIKFLGYKKPLPVSKEDMDVVKAIAADNKIHSAFKYKVGDIIEILGGHCKGLSGRIIEIVDVNSLRIEIQIFNRAIYTSIKVEDIKVA